jgi:hypothetical protein
MPITPAAKLSQRIAEQPQEKALPVERGSCEVVHRMNVVERLVTARPAQFPPQRFGYSTAMVRDSDRHYRRKEGTRVW